MRAYYKLIKNKERGTYHFNLYAPNHRCIGTSSKNDYASKNECEIDLFDIQCGIFRVESYTSKQSIYFCLGRYVKDQSLGSIFSPYANSTVFDPLLNSEMYKTTQSRNKGIEAVKKYAGTTLIKYEER